MAHPFTPADSRLTLHEAVRAAREQTKNDLGQANINSNIGNPNETQARESDHGEPRSLRINVSNTPFDPVLRLALLESGILTQEQLDAAGQKYAAVMGMHPVPTAPPKAAGGPDARSKTTPISAKPGNKT